MDKKKPRIVEGDFKGHPTITAQVVDGHVVQVKSEEG